MRPTKRYMIIRFIVERISILVMYISFIAAPTYRFGVISLYPQLTSHFTCGGIAGTVRSQVVIITSGMTLNAKRQSA